MARLGLARTPIGRLHLPMLLLPVVVACGSATSTTSASPETPDSEPAGASGDDGSLPRTAGASPSPSGATTPAPSSEAASGPGAAPPTTATEEELTFSTGGRGTLPASTVRKILREKMPAYIGCYEKARQRTPDLTGRFAAYLRIEPSGVVSNVEVRGKRSDVDFSRCLIDVVKALKFPKPKGGEVQVVYPLDFSEQ